MPSGNDVRYYRALRYALGKVEPGKWSVFDRVVEAKLGWVRKAVIISRCPICGVKFTGARGVRVHLAGSAECRAMLRALVEEAIEEYEKLKAMVRAYYDGKHKRYVVRLPGGTKLEFGRWGELGDGTHGRGD